MRHMASSTCTGAFPTASIAEEVQNESNTLQGRSLGTFAYKRRETELSYSTQWLRLAGSHFITSDASGWSIRYPHKDFSAT